MDYEMDSDLDDIFEVDVSSGVVQPYMYEPLKSTAPTAVISDNDESSVESEGANGGEHIPDVDQWYG